jgi:hypothetical protein
MSKSPVVPEVMPTTDIQSWEMEKLKAYIEEGVPGIGSIDDDNLGRAMELYLTGKSYREISNILNKPKVMFLYLSNRFNWFQMKMDYLEELDQTMKNRMDESKVRGTDFQLKLVHALEKRMSKVVNKYLATDDDKYIDSIDEKQIAKYMKVFNAVHGSDAPKGGGGVNVNLNMGGGMVLSKGQNGSVDISPKEKSVAMKLKEMAAAKRAEERPQSTDIKKDNNEGDSQ